MNATPSLSRARRTRLKLLAPLLAVAAAAPAAHALNASQWQAIAPSLQAALECRAAPDTNSAAWKALPREEDGSLKPISPAAGFTLFGLPVKEITAYIDDSDGMGQSYTAELGASVAAVRKAAKLDAGGGRETKLGSLMVSEGSPVTLTCTVPGEYDERDYQEN